MLSVNNFERYFGTPAKLATCIIEHDVDEELAWETEEYIKVYTFSNGVLKLLGEFDSSWEFEEWLCSDLSCDEWKKAK